jgi:non-homologous end joining protein Ku
VWSLDERLDGLGPNFSRDVEASRLRPVPDQEGGEHGWTIRLDRRDQLRRVPDQRDRIRSHGEVGGVVQDAVRLSRPAGGRAEGVRGHPRRADRDEEGLEVAKGKLAVIPSEALDALKESATTVVEIERFAPRASIDFSFSKSLYRFIADPKVPGSEGPVNILWNGLLEGEYAAVIDGWISRGGSNPQTLVLHADDAGLRGNTLPYLTDLRDAPTGAFTQNEKAAAMFEQFVAINYTVADYDVSAYTDTYAEKREALIAQAIAGKEITVEETAAAPTGAAPDLMAAMEAALGGAGAKPKPKGGKKKAAVTA